MKRRNTNSLRVYLFLATLLSGCTQGLPVITLVITPPVSTSNSADLNTWLSGSNLADQTPVYGAVGVASPLNLPGSRNGSSSWRDSTGNLWLFGGYGVDSVGTVGDLNDLWKFDVTSLSWMWVAGSNLVAQAGTYGVKGTPSTSNIPPPRDNCSNWTDVSGNFWMFGGESETSGNTFLELNDLWEFNPSTAEWTWISGSNLANQNGTYGTKGLGSVANAPGARDSNITTWTDGMGNLWLFGGEGFDGTGTFGNLNDLWQFNPTNLKWTWVSGSSSANQSGTYGSLGVEAPASIPGARFGASAWKDSSGNLWLFGGNGYDSAGTSDYLNDLWKFNPITAHWAWMGGSNTVDQTGTYGIKGVSSPSTIPGARKSSIFWSNSAGDFFLSGGSGYDSAGTNDALNDFWKFNPSTLEWTWISGSNTAAQAGSYGTKGVGSVSNLLGARSQSAVWADPSSGVVYIFGGDGYDHAGGAGNLNDLWRMKF